jgi:membrane associated rhomboid family serine protease
MFPLYDDISIRRTPVVTYALIAINVLAYLWMSQLPDLQQQMVAYQHGFVPARIMQLSQPHPIEVTVETTVQVPFWGLQVVPQTIKLAPSPRQIGLSLLTCMFLHGSWMHVLLNMWFLWLFGDNVEDRLGSLPYLLLYLAGGLIASGTQWAIEPESTMPMIGASGAIATVLGAYAVTWPWSRVGTLVFLLFFVTIIDVPALIVLGAWFVAQVLAGQESLREAAGGGVAWWAHVGGFLAGMAIMPPLNALLYRPEAEEEHTITD